MSIDEVSLEAILGKLAGGTVLDVATGAGNFAATMEHSFKSCTMITAIDSTMGSLKHISRRMESEVIIPVAMNGNLLAFKKDTFSTVAISNSLHHLKNPEDILQEMLRTLCPGGNFIIMEMFRGGGQTKSQLTHSMLHNWWAAVDSRNGIVHNPVFTRAELKQWAESIGLSALEFHILEDTSGDPFASEQTEYLNKALDAYEKRTNGVPELIEQGKQARAHLDENGFTGSRALIAVGMKPA